MLFAMIKKWAILVVLIIALTGAYNMMNSNFDEGQPKRVPLKAPDEIKDEDQTPKPKDATLTPGRVVELNTSKGRIAFVLFEKDCPITTKRIVDLVNAGTYNNVKFERVIQGQLIQTGKCKKDVSPIGCEVCNGLTHAKGTVGMARVGNDYNSGTSVFYILLEPWPHLDYEYTAFGRLIKGMDVAMKIKLNDVIKSARVRPLTGEDEKLLDKVLTIEAERKTE